MKIYFKIMRLDLFGGYTYIYDIKGQAKAVETYWCVASLDSLLEYIRGYVMIMRIYIK